MLTIFYTADQIKQIQSEDQKELQRKKAFLILEKYSESGTIENYMKPENFIKVIYELLK